LPALLKVLVNKPQTFQKLTNKYCLLRRTCSFINITAEAVHVHETWATCNAPGVHDERFELRMGYPSVAEFTANDDNDEIIIINYLFQIVQAASQAFPLWE
jgi:hypothetical protein